MRGESVCSNFIRMKYGSFDDYRMRFFSWGGSSFLKRVKERKDSLNFLDKFYESIKSPKFPSSIGDIV